MKKIAFAILFTAVLFSTSCKNHSDTNTESYSYTIQISDGNKEDLVSSPQIWHETNKRLLVLFGYDFNTPETVKEITDILQNKYGLDEDNGLIYPVIYPGHFKHGTKAYPNELLAVLQDDALDLCGVLLLGAPERTHTALARNQDKWEQNVPYPVIALFPQDEILGIEANCDIVLDKGESAEITGGLVAEETETVLIENAPEIIIKTIDYMLTIDGHLQTDSTLQNHLSQMLKNHNIHHYMDPETGLQSINHFVLN